MDKIIYKKTLNLHQGGIQFVLQGFTSADTDSRQIQISLMANGKPYLIPTNAVAEMCVQSPNETEPTVCDCTVYDNVITCDIPPIATEGITLMQIRVFGDDSVFYTPKFAVEVTASMY
jgi:hypothetical protein